jgi:hypothetical protein
MKKITFNLPIVLLVFLFIMACESQPKVIEDQPFQTGESALRSNHSTDMPTMQNEVLDGHLVVVKEILNTEKYSYLNVTEDGETYWIAIPRKEVQLGNTYYYKGGLLKKNFESKEYNRVFETIYLVSDVISHPSNSGIPEWTEAITKEESSNASVHVVPVEGSIKLSELFSNLEKFEGKLIQVTGQCVKVNPKIMGRNWIHIQDGSGDGLDLTITTTEHVNLDATVTFEGSIGLNRDFGAGYKYDVIMEKATLN